MAWKVKEAPTTKIVFGPKEAPDCVVTIYKFTADKALHFGAFIAALVGKPLMAALSTAALKKDKGEAINVTLMLESCLEEIDEALLKLTPAALDALTFDYIVPTLSIRIGENVYEGLHGLEGKEKILEIFSGHNTEFFDVVVAAVKWNLNDFLAVRLLKDLRAPA